MSGFWDELKNALGFGTASAKGRQPADSAVPVRNLQQENRAAPDKTQAAAVEHPPEPSAKPVASEAVGILNADKHVFGARLPVREPPCVFDGILNEDLYEWKTFKSGVLNADRHEWALPGILNAPKHAWRKRPVH